MLILIRFHSAYEEKAKKILATLETHRDGPGYRPISRQTYFFPLNEIRHYSDGEVKMIWEVGLGGKKDFYKKVVNPLKRHFIPITVEEFLTESDK